MRRFVLFWLCLWPALASGQTMSPLPPQQLDRPLPEQPVRQRAQPEFTPAGMRVGGFVLHPSLSLATVYDDNIDATSGPAEADLVAMVEPSLSADSDWSRHHLRLDMSGSYHRYFDQADRSMVADGHVGAACRVDASRALTITTTLGHTWTHEERGSFDDDGRATAPTAFLHTAGSAGLRYQPGRLGLDGLFQVERYGFENGSTADGATIDNGDRDRTVATAQLAAVWELHPGSTAFVRGAVDVSRHDRAVDDFGDRRDSQSWRGEGGLRLDLAPVMTLDLHAGTFRRAFDGFSDLPGIIGGGTLTWLPTALTTVTLRAERREAATSVAGASGLLVSNAGLSVDHELRRNIILGAMFELSYGEFVGIDRTDLQLSAGADITYNLDRHIFVNGSYGFRQRRSSASGYDYERNRILVRMGYRL